MSINLLHINEKTQEMISEIKEENPDIIGFQEYTNPWRKALKKALGISYPHIIHIYRSDSFGMAFYSKLPLTSQDVFSLANSRVPAFKITIDFQGKSLNLYNIHMLPPRTLEYVTTQRQQFRDLIRRLENEKEGTLLLGDYNWTNFNRYHNTLIKAGFKESHNQRGFGIGSTWPVLSFTRYLPGFRIDHLYLSKDLLCLSHKRGIGLGSDHRPIITDITFK